MAAPATNSNGNFPPPSRNTDAIGGGHPAKPQVIPGIPVRTSLSVTGDNPVPLSYPHN